MKKPKVAVLTLLFVFAITTPIVLTFANAQINQTVEEKMVAIAEGDANHIQSMITYVYSDGNASAKIENAGLMEQFEDNVALYQTEGSDKLATAQQALANSNYDLAADSALEALTVFRQVYSSLKSILEASGLQDDSLVSNQELLDAVNRELQRVDALQNLLPANPPQEILTLLEAANSTLLQAKAALQNGEDDKAQTLYLEAKQSITQIYQYLKTQAEESNAWRLSAYCERLQQRIQERFRYGSENGVNFTSTLKALGYQTEEQFMGTMQNRIQNVKSQTEIQNAVNECLSLNQMVQEMEQALNQAINQHQQGQNGTSGNNGAGGTTGGSGGNGGFNGSGNSGNGGNN